MNPLTFPYPSRRQVIYGRRGMVCTSQPLAAGAGLDILKAGGNAIDAAVATAIAMTVLEPVSNGIGSDTFALVWTGGGLHGLNGSGYAPAGLSGDALREQGYEKMPVRGWVPVNVPGTPSAWRALSRRFGRLPFEKLFESAIRYAREGYPVSPIVAIQWREQCERFSRTLSGPCHQGWFDTFAPQGRAPEPGELWASEDMARTLEELAETGCESFYRGDLARRIDQFSQDTGGYLRGGDLAGYEAKWVQPISVRYKGYDVWEIPPNGHGLVALMALNTLGNDAFPCRDDARTIHLQLEAMKLAFADGQKYITDPAYMTRTVEQLLDPGYALSRRASIADTAQPPIAGDPACGGTIYLCAADGEGNMVSLIQSNYMGFGSGVVVPGTGVSLNDRGANFSLDPSHDNYLRPGKRPYHTIIPGFLTRGGRPVGPFGVMGGFMQPQGHMQVMMNTIDFDLNPQAALDAPRWQWAGGMRIEVEPGFPQHLVEELAARGHDIHVSANARAFGRGEIIWRDENGVLMGATEPRADGMAAAW